MIVRYCIVASILTYVICEDCSLHYNPIPESKTQLLNSIAALKNHRFTATYGSATYTVTICSEVSNVHQNAAATKSTNNDKNITVLGRLNDTHIVGGGDWILMTYASGDFINKSDHCRNNSMKTAIMITCNKDLDEALFSLNDDDTSTDCQVTFTLQTAAVCSNLPKGMSKGTVFCVLLLTGSLMYLMVGVAYRRIMAGAQGLEQIPHYQFWRDLGSLQADGCDFICRKGAGGREEPWNRITSNFNDPADEPLLHP